MGSVWSLINMKGGVAKSTSVANLGAELASTYKLRVLCIDNDAQASLSIAFGVESEALDCTLSDVFATYGQENNVAIEDTMLQLMDRLWLVPSTIDLAAADMILMENVKEGREFVLADMIKNVKQHFDVILIDNQPSLSLLPLNSLAASDYVIVPCSTEYLSNRGLDLIKIAIEKAKQTMNPGLEFFGVIATRHKTRNLHNREVLELLEEKWPILGVVPESAKVPDAIYHDSRSVVLSAPKSQPAVAYKEIAKKMYEEIKKEAHLLGRAD